MTKNVYKSIEGWLKYFNFLFLILLYGKKVSKKIDNSWKGVKIQSTYKPAYYPKNPNKNNITLYLELQNTGKLWKRK